MEKLETFDFGKGPELVVFEEAMKVTNGVECDVYSVKDNVDKDLGIIRVDLGKSTPHQKVINGEKTIEGHISGDGFLIIKKVNGSEEIYPTTEGVNQQFELVVEIGETMQWIAGENSSLELFEICIPPYEDGRFEDL